MVVTANGRKFIARDVEHEENFVGLSPRFLFASKKVKIVVKHRARDRSISLHSSFIGPQNY